jgi:hypothetical protein
LVNVPAFASASSPVGAPADDLGSPKTPGY